MKVNSRPAAAGAGSTTLNPGGQRIPTPQPGPHPLAVLLFGKRPAKPIDRKKRPHLKKAMQKLDLIAEQISDVMGVAAGTFEVELRGPQRQHLQGRADLRGRAVA